MAVVVVTSKLPGEGRTGIAAAIARHYAYLGRPVRIARAAGDESSETDAAFFASLAFAPGSPEAAVDAATTADPGEGSLLVLEASPGAAAGVAGATVVNVARGAAAGSPAGVAAVVVTDAPASAKLPDSAIAVAEDRVLAGFTVEEARIALNADTIVEGDDAGTTCDHLVIAPISSDAGQPYFKRFGTKAVVVRFDRTDMHLAAMKADPQVLILTGGKQPSGYLFDAAGAQGIPVLLSRSDTENTVIALEGIFDRTRFHGQRKLDRMAALLDGAGLFEALS